MQTKPVIPFAVLRDTRTSPAALAGAITMIEAAIAEREAVVANLESRLSIEHALSHLGMASRDTRSMKEQIASDLTLLANQRLTLAGLKAIDAARRELPDSAFMRERSTKFEFDKFSGQMVEVPAGRA